MDTHLHPLLGKVDMNLEYKDNFYPLTQGVPPQCGRVAQPHATQSAHYIVDLYYSKPETTLPLAAYHQQYIYDA